MDNLHFTFDCLTVNDCRLGHDPLIQFTYIGPQSGLAGRFRGLSITNSRSASGVVNFGGGPRTNKTEQPVSYYFHDLPTAGIVTQATSASVSGRNRRRFSHCRQADGRRTARSPSDDRFSVQSVDRSGSTERIL